MSNGMAYGQGDEITFIKGLGSFGRWEEGRRVRCLRGYLAALDGRKVWGFPVDVAVLRKTAEAELAAAR